MVAFDTHNETNMMMMSNIRRYNVCIYSLYVWQQGQLRKYFCSIFRNLMLSYSVNILRLYFGFINLNVWTSAKVEETSNCLHPSSSALSGQPLIDYLGAHLQVNYVRSAAGDDIVLTNSGPLDIPPCSRWSIYFSHSGMTTYCKRPRRLQRIAANPN